jgi:hypothetical protein
VTIGRGDAMDLLSKWFSEGTLLECRASFPFLAAEVRGRIRSFSPAEVRFESDDDIAKLAFALEDSIDFSFGDVDDFVPTARFKGTLVLIYSLGASEKKASDTILLSEVV